MCWELLWKPGNWLVFDFCRCVQNATLQRMFVEFTVRYWHVIGGCGGANVLLGRCLRKQVWHERKHKNKTTGGGRGKGALNVMSNLSCVTLSTQVSGWQQCHYFQLTFQEICLPPSTTPLRHSRYSLGSYYLENIHLLVLCQAVVCVKHKEGEETRCPWTDLKWPWIAVQIKSYSEGKGILTQPRMCSSERKIILVLFEHAGNFIPSATALIGQGLKSWLHCGAGAFERINAVIREGSL